MSELTLEQRKRMETSHAKALKIQAEKEAKREAGVRTVVSQGLTSASPSSCNVNYGSLLAEAAKHIRRPAHGFGVSHASSHRGCPHTPASARQAPEDQLDEYRYERRAHVQSPRERGPPGVPAASGLRAPTGVTGMSGARGTPGASGAASCGTASCGALPSLTDIDWDDDFSPSVSKAQPVSAGRQGCAHRHEEPNEREGLDEPCSICFSEQLRDQGVVGELGEIDCCSHIFCFGCIRRWCEECSRCPLCKRDVESVARTDGRSTLEKVRVEQKEQKAPELTEEELRALAEEEDGVYNCVVCNCGDDEVPSPILFLFLFLSFHHYNHNHHHRPHVHITRAGHTRSSAEPYPLYSVLLCMLDMHMYAC